jgi:hypothetical protein
MLPRVRSLAVALGFAMAGACVPAAAQAANADTATPDGPATLRPIWNGPVAAICEGPRAVVAFTLRVGANSRPGRVRLRVLARRQEAPIAVRSGAWVDLPATPGDHRFPARLHVGGCETGEEIAVDQETGGHTILYSHPPGDGDPRRDPSRLHELDVFRPPLADGATAPPSERRSGQQLLIRLETQADVDRDGLADARLAMRAVPLRGGRLRVRLTSDQPGDVSVVVRLRGGVRVRATVRMRGAGTRSVTLRVPRRARRATVVASMPGADPVRRRVTLRR